MNGHDGLKINHSCHKVIKGYSLITVSSLGLQVAACLVHFTFPGNRALLPRQLLAYMGTSPCGAGRPLALRAPLHLSEAARSHRCHFACLFPLLGYCPGAEPDRFRQSCSTNAEHSGSWRIRPRRAGKSRQPWRCHTVWLETGLPLPWFLKTHLLIIEILDRAWPPASSISQHCPGVRALQGGAPSRQLPLNRLL